MDASKLLTIKEVADLRGVVPDTVTRSIKKGDYPRAARGDGPNDPWQIPLGDLVAAGHYDPSTAAVEPEVAIRTTRAERELVEVRAQLAKAEAAAESLQRELAARDDQLRWLRKHADALTSPRAVA